MTERTDQLDRHAAHDAVCDWSGMPDDEGFHEADVQVQEVGAVAIRVECEWWTP